MTSHDDTERDDRYRDELARQREWEEFWSQSPSEAQVQRAIREGVYGAVEDAKAKLIADWRSRNPEATCSDAVALELAAMEAAVGRRRA